MDFERIWNDQTFDEDLAQFISEISELVRNVILAAPGNGNITKSCKKRECRPAVSAVSVQVPKFLQSKVGSRPESKQETGEEILKLLSDQGHAMDRSSITKKLGLSGKEWTTAISELIEAGLVAKIGRATEALYSVVEKL